MRTARCLASLLMLAVLPAFQGPDRPNTDRPDRDPPGRVGRLSFVTGSVSFRPGDVDDWVAATVNYPLHDGDHLWTDNDARAEITVGSTAFRLAPQTGFGFLALDDRTVQVRLSQGSLNVRVRDLGEDESLEIDTPNGAVSLLRSGVYRLDVDTTGDTTSVTVRSGEGEVTAAGSAFPVRREQTAVVVGGDAPTYDVHDAMRSDDWEDWCASRDRRWEDSRSARYVSHGVIGYEDLDDNGDWRETPDYGAVWVPRGVATGWAPYRYGHWAWVEPWGWTWIDDASWGFAPFHYGRWVYVGDGWAWVPGRVVARPVYAPALVVFVGGRNWSLAIAGGSGVAWFPLAPEEPYVPAYRVSNTYIRNVNVTNVNVTNINVTNVNVTNINYRNRHQPDAVTVVSHETFVESRTVNRGVIVVPRDRLDQARVVGATARVAPDRRSVLGQPAIVEMRRPPTYVMTRQVVVQRQPPPPPVPFSAREQALRARPGRPLDDATITTLRARTPGTSQRLLVRPAAPARPVRSEGPTPTPTPTPALRPAREGLPPPRSVPPSVAEPQPARQARPARDAARPAPAPVERPARPAREERPQPMEHPQPTERRRPADQPQPTERPTRPAARAERPMPTPAPAPAAAPKENKAPRAERPTPERVAPTPPARAEPKAQQPERRPAPEERPRKDRKAERDTTQEKKPS